MSQPQPAPPPAGPSVVRGFEMAAGTAGGLAAAAGALGALLRELAARFDLTAEATDKVRYMRSIGAQDTAADLLRMLASNTDTVQVVMDGTAKLMAEAARTVA